MLKVQFWLFENIIPFEDSITCFLFDTFTLLLVVGLFLIKISS